MPKSIDTKALRERCEKLGKDGRNFAFWYMFGTMEFWLDDEKDGDKAEYCLRHLQDAAEAYEKWQKEKEPSKTA